MKISIYNQQKTLKIPKNNFKKLVHYLLDNEKIHTDEIGVYFVDKKKCSEIHKKYFNDASSTDCMSFPVDDVKNPDQGHQYLGDVYRRIDNVGNPVPAAVNHHYLGDVFICTPVAKESCAQYGNTLEEETALYVIHSILHLVGYDDISESKRKIMRKKEKEYLKIFKEMKGRS